MDEKKRATGAFTQTEIELVKQLRRQPKIMERVQHILEIANSSDGPLKTADEIEEMLIAEMRQLGNATMTGWAEQAQQRVAAELRAQDTTVLKRKKKR